VAFFSTVLGFWLGGYVPKLATASLYIQEVRLFSGSTGSIGHTPGAAAAVCRNFSIVGHSKPFLLLVVEGRVSIGSIGQVKILVMSGALKAPETLKDQATRRE
jgi:hypothetical protein